MSQPIRLVRAIVVNHNGGDLVRRCVDSLLGVSWPDADLDIVVSDNASSDDSLAPFVAEPRVRIVDNGENLGFGAAVNRALATEGRHPDAVLLLNPDAWIEPDALSLLAEALTADPRLGAACPRILFDRPMAELRISTEPAMKPTLHAVDVDGSEGFEAVHGLSGAERRPAADDRSVWVLGPQARFHVPHGQRVVLELGVKRPGPITAQLGTTVVTTQGNPGSNRVSLQSADADALTVIQNDGSDVAADGTGRNRHFHEPLPEAGDPNPVFAWCGAAALLRTDALDDVGVFAEPFFLYYEDTDLAWRFQTAGRPPAVVPDALVWHRHSASTGQGRALTEVHQHRNRVLMMVRNASWTDAVTTLLGLAATTLSITGRGTIDRLRGDTGRLIMARYRFSALWGALRLLPWALRSRRALHRRR